MKEPRDAYKVLQVDPEADLEVIQAAYRRLAQKYHPDRAATGPDGDQASVRMVEINAAWEHVRDEKRRAAYDRERSRTMAPTETPASAWPGSSASAAGNAGQAGTPSQAGTRAQPGSASQPGDGIGTAGPPPGRPSGSVMNFGRYAGWSLGEIGRRDPGYLEWLDRMPIGRPYRAELDVLLRSLGRRLSEQAEAANRQGLFRRR